MSTIVSSVWNVISAIISTALAVFSGDWAAAWEGIADIFIGIWEGIRNVITSIIDGIVAIVQNLINKMIDLINLIPLVDIGHVGEGAISKKSKVIGTGFASGAGKLPPKAKGGFVQGGMSYLVGEKGPERFTPSVSGNITPNDKLGGLTIVINGNVSSKEIVEEYGDILIKKLKLHSAIV